MKPGLPLFIIIALAILLVCHASGGIPKRKPAVLGSASIATGARADGGAPAVAYDIHLMPGQHFTGYYYYFSGGDTVRGHISESPQVAWITLGGVDVISLSCSDIHPLAIHFIAPGIPGVYHTNLVDDSSHWQSISVTLTVTPTPEPDYIEDVQITRGDSLIDDYEFTWEGFGMSCVPVYLPADSMNVNIAMVPELPNYSINPSEFTVRSIVSEFAELAFGAADTGMYTTSIVIEYQWYSVPQIIEYNIHVVDPLVVTSPRAGDRWIVGEPDTIRWECDTLRNIEIQLSVDGGANYTYLTTVAETESLYVWYPPHSLTTSSQAMFTLADAVHSDVSATSGKFTLRAYDMVRKLPGETLERFEPALHGWQFTNTNDPPTMWPESWYQRFDYPNINDDITGRPYSRDFLLQPPKPFAADFPDWPLFVDVFGVDKCYHNSIFGNPNEPKEVAVEAWKSLKEEWSGSCFGFPTSALLYFEQQTGFIAANQGVTPGQTLFDLPLTDLARRTVNKYFEYQSDAEQIAHLEANMYAVSPQELLAELKAMLLDDVGDHRTLSMLEPNGAGAHTLIPYRLVRDEADQNDFRIFVYDCNSPGQQDAFILIDSLANTWEEYLGLSYGIGHDGLLLNLPVSHFLTRPVLSLLEEAGAPPPSLLGAQSDPAERTQIYVSDTSAILITSPGGDTLGYKDGRYLRQISGGFGLVSSVAVHRPPYAYDLPDSDYTVTLSSFPDSDASLLVKEKHTLYKYSRTATHFTETDLIYLGSGIGVSNPDDSVKSADIKTIMNVNAGEHVYTLEDLQIASGGMLHVERLPGDGIVVLNTGPAATYSLDAKALGSAGEVRFHYPGLFLAQQSAHLITMRDDSVRSVSIRFDEGNDGSVEDSIIVDGVISAAVDEETIIPGSYFLSQNYPNPFNPVTHLAFEIPQSEFVTLRVYDVLGREIATLVNERKSPGRYEVPFGSALLPSGVYIYQLTAGEFTERKKMVLIR